MNNKITVSNKILDASYSLSWQEKKFIMYFVSLIHPKQIVEKDTKFTFSYEDYAKTLQITISEARKLVKATLNHQLVEKGIYIHYIDEEGKEAERYTSWVAEYDIHYDYCTIIWAPTIIEYISLLKRDFTSITMGVFLRCKSTSTARIYMNIKHAEDLGQEQWKIEVGKFRDNFVIPDSYSISDITRRFLVPAKNFINTHTSLTVDFSLIKDGRKVRWIDWKIKSKKITKAGKVKEARKEKRKEQIEHTKETKTMIKENGLDGVTFTSS